MSPITGKSISIFSEYDLLIIDDGLWFAVSVNDSKLRAINKLIVGHGTLISKYTYADICVHFFETKNGNYLVNKLKIEVHD